MQTDQWTENDVKDLLTNPLNVGIGPSKPMVDVDLFARVGAKMIEDEMGVVAYLGRVHDNLRDAGAAEALQLGMREQFVARWEAELREAESLEEGIKSLVVSLQWRARPS